MEASQAGREPETPDVTVAADSRAPRPVRGRPATGPDYERAFGAGDLPAVRRLATSLGRRAGLSPGRLDDFVLAVNEMATSAVCRGDRARLRLWVCGGNVRCEVRGGGWVSARQASAMPDDTDSLRLWVVSQVSSEVSLSYGPGEPTACLSMRIDDQSGSPSARAPSRGRFDGPAAGGRHDHGSPS